MPEAAEIKLLQRSEWTVTSTTSKKCVPLNRPPHLPADVQILNVSESFILEQVADAHDFQERIRSTHPSDNTKLLLNTYGACSKKSRYSCETYMRLHSIRAIEWLMYIPLSPASSARSSDTLRITGSVKRRLSRHRIDLHS